MICSDKVYDCNEEFTPEPITEYKEKKKMEYPQLMRRDSTTLIESNHLVGDSLKYLKRFELEFQKEVRPLIEKEHNEEGKFKHLI